MSMSENDREIITDLSREGYQFLREGELEAAEAKFHDILRLDNRNNYALVGLGDSLRKRNRCKEAAEYYRRCLEMQPENNYALFGLADCYKTMRMYHKAIEVWERYLELDSDNITVLTRVADAHRKARNFDRSRELYEKVLEKEEDNAYALIGLGHLHYDFRKYNEALEYWMRMYRNPGAPSPEDRNESRRQPDIRVLTAIGNCHRKLKKFDSGTRFFAEALDREPDNFYALFGIADCYRGLNDPGTSLEYWNRILEKSPENKVILTRAGDAYRALGSTDTAEMYYKKALNIEFDAYAVLGLALIAKKQERYEDALESLLRLAETDHDNHRAFLEAADCALNLGRHREAVEILERYLAGGGHNRSVAEMHERLTRQGRQTADGQ